MLDFLSPAAFLAALIALTLTAIGVHRLVAARRARQLKALATRLGLKYNAADRFGLGDRLAGSVPTPGASRVNVRDVMYALEAGNQFYVFVVEYVVGTLGQRELVRRVAAASEAPAAGLGNVMFADESANHEDEYPRLLDRLRAAAGREADAVPA